MSNKDFHLFGRPPGLVAIAAYKALWGAAEIAAGFLVFFSEDLIVNELIEDPQDHLMNWVAAHFTLDFAQTAPIGLLLIASGALKLVLAGGIWYRSWAVRNAAIVFFSAVALFSFYRLSQRFSAFELLPLIGDVLIIFYLWKILPRHLRGHRLQ